MSIEEFKKEIRGMSKSRLLKLQDTYMWKQGNLKEDFYEYLVAIKQELNRR